MKKQCPTCNTIFYKKPSDSKKYWEIKKYCSIKCSGTLIKKGQHFNPNGEIKKGQIGALNLSFKGGRSFTQGYVRILIPGTGKYQLEHRLIVEEYLGRKLFRDEVVHHLNGNRHDNRIENLQVIPKKRHDQIETTKRWQENPESFNHR